MAKRFSHLQLELVGIPYLTVAVLCTVAILLCRRVGFTAANVRESRGNHFLGGHYTSVTLRSQAA